MAKRYFIGQSTSIAQVVTVQILTFDAATTYKITIGGVVVSVPGNADVNTTASDLQAVLAASDAPSYFKAITWEVSTDTITGTATKAGIPFTATSSVTGGTGTIGAVTETTASAGPAHFDTAANYDGGVLPGVGDDVILENGSQDILFGLDTITAALNSFRKMKSFTGKLGLDRKVFQTDLTATDKTVDEYRETYLKIDCLIVETGENPGVGIPGDSTRVKINNIRAGATLTTVHSTASKSSEANLPAIRFLASNAGADFVVLSAPGGVGIGADFIGETSTIGDVTVRAANTGDKVFIGEGVTLANFDQSGGASILSAAVDISGVVKASGGTLTIDGDFNIAVLTNDGATIFDNHVKDAGSANTVVNNNSGTLNGLGSNEARIWDTVNQGDNATLTIDPTIVTITTRNLPSTKYKLVTTPA